MNANLSDADLSGADLSNADLRGARLVWANFEGVDLTDAKIWLENSSIVAVIKGIINYLE